MKKAVHIPLRRRIRVYLAQHDMTQFQLATQLGISKNHLSGILARKQTPSLRVAVQLEALVGVPCRELLRAPDHELAIARR